MKKRNAHSVLPLFVGLVNDPHSPVDFGNIDGYAEIFACRFEDLYRDFPHLGVPLVAVERTTPGLYRVTVKIRDLALESCHKWAPDCFPDHEPVYACCMSVGRLNDWEFIVYELSRRMRKFITPFRKDLLERLLREIERQHDKIPVSTIPTIAPVPAPKRRRTSFFSWLRRKFI